MVGFVAEKHVKEQRNFYCYAHVFYYFTTPSVQFIVYFTNIQAMLEQANADVVATKSVMDTLTDKTKEYLQTTDNCLTSLAVGSCCACLIMVVVVFFLYG